MKKRGSSQQAREFYNLIDSRKQTNAMALNKPTSLYDALTLKTLLIILFLSNKLPSLFSARHDLIKPINSANI